MGSLEIEEEGMHGVPKSISRTNATKCRTRRHLLFSKTPYSHEKRGVWKK
jgi:hypothetical protein